MMILTSFEDIPIKYNTGPTLLQRSNFDSSISELGYASALALEKVSLEDIAEGNIYPLPLSIYYRHGDNLYNLSQ